MPLFQLLQQSSLEPEAAEVARAAFGEVIDGLHLPKVPRSVDAAVARKIVDLVRRGENDKNQLVARVRRELGLTNSLTLSGSRLPHKAPKSGD
jgi:hypothetical protein